MTPGDCYQVLAGLAVLVAVAYIGWYVIEGYETDD